MHHILDFLWNGLHNFWQRAAAGFLIYFTATVVAHFVAVNPTRIHVTRLLLLAICSPAFFYFSLQSPGAARDFGYEDLFGSLSYLAWVAAALVRRPKSKGSIESAEPT